MVRPVLPVLLLLSLHGSASAQTTQDVLFNATVAAICTLTVNSNGTMAASANLQTLSSKIGVGSPASLSLSTTGDVELSLDPVTVVDAPTSDVTATSWTPTYAASGAHSIGETAATTNLAAPGTSTVSVHLVGTKSGSNRFSAGNYQATVTVRCE